MAGHLQLSTSGVQDVFFTENPQYTHFLEKVPKHTHFSREFSTTTTTTTPGGTVKFTIPQNIGDLLANISLKIKLPTLNTDVKYIESVGHALVDHVNLIIGGKIIQRIPRDYLQIYSEHNVTQTKQRALKELIGKYPERQVLHLRSNDYNIITSNDYDELLVDIPFYFHNNPELYLPIYALKRHEIEVEVKLSPASHFVIRVSDGTLASDNFPESLEVSMLTEVIFLDDPSMTETRDYVITQLQTEVFEVEQGVQSGKFFLGFENPVKELYFVIQRDDPGVHPFDYDNNLQVSDNEYILYENLDYLTLDLDNEQVITEDVGNVLFLKGVQGTIHHSKTQLLRRFYSYSFAMEPEKWYPTGHINFSFIKNQILNMQLTPCPNYKRQIRVYAVSYNILRVEDGTARTLF